MRRLNKPLNGKIVTAIKSLLKQHGLNDRSDFCHIENGFGVPNVPTSSKDLQRLANRLVNALQGISSLTPDKNRPEDDAVLRDVIQVKSDKFSLRETFVSLNKVKSCLWRFRQVFLKCLFPTVNDEEAYELLGKHEIQVTDKMWLRMKEMNSWLGKGAERAKLNVSDCAEFLQRSTLYKSVTSKQLGMEDTTNRSRFDCLFGPVLCRRLRKTKFCRAFIDRKFNDVWLTKLRDLIDEMFDGQSLNELDFNVSLKPTKDSAIYLAEGFLESSFPEMPTDRHMDTFLRSLKIVASFPSAKELPDLMFRLAGLHVNKGLEKEQFHLTLKNFVLNWLADRKGTFITENDHEQFIRAFRTTIAQYYVVDQLQTVFDKEMQTSYTFSSSKFFRNGRFVCVESNSPFLTYLILLNDLKDLTGKREDYICLKSSELTEEYLLDYLELLTQENRFNLVLYLENCFSEAFDKNREKWSKLIENSAKTFVISRPENSSASSIYKLMLDISRDETCKIAKDDARISYDDLTKESQVALLNTKLTLKGSDSKFVLKDVLGVQKVTSKELAKAFTEDSLESLITNHSFSVGSIPLEEHAIANIIYLGLTVSLTKISSLAEKLCLKSKIVIFNLNNQHPAYESVMQEKDKNENILIKHSAELLNICQRSFNQKVFFIEACERGDSIKFLYDPELYMKRQAVNVKLLHKKAFDACPRDAFLCLDQDQSKITKGTSSSAEIAQRLTEINGLKLGNTNVFLVSQSVLANPENCLPHFENYHHISWIGSETQWLKSFNSIDNIRRYLIQKPKTKIAESMTQDFDYIAKQSNSLLLVGTAGSGKSACIHQMHKVLADSCWVFRKDLKFFSASVICKNGLPEDETSALKDIAEYLTADNTLEYPLLMFRLIYSDSQPSPPIHVLFDGFDEILQENERVIAERIIYILSKKVAVSVSTKAEFQTQLERTLRRFAVECLPLKSDHIKDYLQRFFLDYVNLDLSLDSSVDLHEIITRSVNKVASFPPVESLQMGVPLKFRMIAEILVPELVPAITEKREIDLKVIENSFKIIDEFIRRKYDIYFNVKRAYELTHLDKALLVEAYDSIFTEHAFRYLDLTSVLTKLNLKKWTLSNEQKSNLLQIGIVSSSDRKQLFLHNAYADFFAARALLKNTKYSKRALKELHKRVKRESVSDKTRWKGLLSLLSDETSSAESVDREVYYYASVTPQKKMTDYFAIE